MQQYLLFNLYTLFGTLNGVRSRTLLVLHLFVHIKLSCSGFPIHRDGQYGIDLTFEWKQGILDVK